MVVGAITYSFGGLKGRRINNIDRYSYNNNKDTNNTSGDNDCSNYWNIEDSYKHILKNKCKGWIGKEVKSDEIATVSTNTVRIVFLFIDVDENTMNVVIEMQ